MLANGLDLRPEKTGWFYTSWWFFHQPPLKNMSQNGKPLCVCVRVLFLVYISWLAFLLAGLLVESYLGLDFFELANPSSCRICFLEAVELLWDCSGQAGPYNSETSFRAFWGDSPTFHHISG